MIYYTILSVVRLNAAILCVIMLSVVTTEKLEAGATTFTRMPLYWTGLNKKEI